MNSKRIEELKQKAKAQATQWALERGVCGEHRFQLFYETALIHVTVEECAMVASRAENNDRELRCVYDVITEHFGLK